MGGESGRLITFEGGEGSGKSTQARRLAENLQVQGRKVVLTREPGGTLGAEQIRGLLVKGAADRWDAWSEALLVNAARRDHVARIIAPALADGSWVICDRFVHSTLAYQGLVGGIGTTPLRALHAMTLGRLWPDLTLIFDLSAEEGLARVSEWGGSARFEARGLGFHTALRTAFQELASAEPEVCRLLDARGEIDSVAQRVRVAVRSLGGT